MIEAKARDYFQGACDRMGHNDLDGYYEKKSNTKFIFEHIFQPLAHMSQG